MSARHRHQRDLTNCRDKLAFSTMEDAAERIRHNTLAVSEMYICKICGFIHFTKGEDKYETVKVLNKIKYRPVKLGDIIDLRALVGRRGR